MSQSVRAVERALDILLCFDRKEPARSLTQIANSVHMSKATVHRLLTALEKKRFITRDRVPGRYCLNYRFIEMASTSRNAAGSTPPDRSAHELAAESRFTGGYPTRR